MATIYLHIGTPKTGTTALQNFLASNTEILEKNDICYADLGYRYPGVGIHRNGHFLVTTNYRNEDGERILDLEQKDYKEGLEKVAELAKSYSKIILSDEGIWKQSLEDRENFWPTLKKDLDEKDLDIKIIVYFRRQDLWVQSHWAQKVKEGSVYNFDEYLESPLCREYPLDYYKYMNMLSDVFGKEALIIRVYEKGQYKGAEHTIQSDFLDIFGLKMTDDFVLEKAIYNTSLEGNYLEIKRLLNAVPEFWSNQHILIRTIKSIQDKKLFEHNFKKMTFFKPGKQEEFLDKFAVSNSGIARDYLGREDGILFYDKIKELPERKIEDGELLRDTIFIYAKMIDIMDQRTSELEEQNKNLKKELRELKKESREKDKELKKMIQELQQTALLFRLKRKTNHILGKDKSNEV